MQFISANIKHGESKTFVFEKTVSNATAVVQGYNVGFGPHDNHVQNINVKAGVAVSGNSVTVKATCQINDDTGHVGTGSIDIVCLVD